MKQITFQSIFDTPSVKQDILNAQAQTPDGRIWEYLYATEAISQYMVVSNPANTDVDTIASSTNGASQTVFLTEASAGWTVGAYQDHWMIVDDGTGEGQVAKIKDNTADTLELYTDYALGTALTVAGSSDIVIRHEPDAEKVAITVLKTPLKGVAQVAFASGDYGWFLKRGIGGVLAGEVITINVSLTPGDDTEGTAEIGDTGNGPFDESYIGRCLVANTTADLAALVDVNIA
jgi:hypothetical protein|tara:strand:+ start:836 stop:1534 length:699 start_codon:yes stop_codon:yes gene_type:complete